jgi:hypothetical protein
VGAQVRVVNGPGQQVGLRVVGLAENWGAQTPFTAHFGLPPGAYQVEVRYSDGTLEQQRVEVKARGLERVVMGER